MGTKYPTVWGALTCGNVWLATGDKWLGVTFIALAIATLFLVRESDHD